MPPRRVSREPCPVNPVPAEDCRVRLRPLLPADAQTFADWGADPQFCRHAEWRAGRPPADRLRFWEELISAPPPDLVRLGADCDQELVGYVDLHGTAPGRRELGYTIGGRDRWGLGLGTAAAAAGLTYGFSELGLDEIWAEALDATTASVRILQRLGMRETGRGDRRSFLERATHYRQFVINADEWSVGLERAARSGTGTGLRPRPRRRAASGRPGPGPR